MRNHTERTRIPCLLAEAPLTLQLTALPAASSIQFTSAMTPRATKEGTL